MTHAARLRWRRLSVLVLTAAPTMLACDARSGMPGDAPAAPAAPVSDTTAVDFESEAVPPAPRVATDGLVIEDLLVAEPVTGERAALYLTLRSTGGDVLLRVDAVHADSASLHETSMEGGRMRMRPVAQIPIPAGGQAKLRPGGLHGMLEGLTGRWAVGDTVRIRLHFRDAGVVEAPALIIPYIELDVRFPGATDGG